MNEKSIAVDLDGVVFEYDSWKGLEHFGKVLKGARPALRKLRALGYKIIIYTIRTNPSLEMESVERLHAIVYKALKKAKIPFDEIALEGKPLAKYYVDDRAIRFHNWKQTFNEIKWREEYPVKRNE